MTVIRHMQQELVDLVRDVRSEKVLPALFCGLIAGVLLLVFGVSMAALVFSGPLAPFVSAGVGIVLFANFALSLAGALGSGFRGAIVATPIPSVMMLAAIAASFELEGRTLFATLVATALIGTAASGLCFLLIGWFRIASLLRFIPYSVAGGFIAGTGGLACILGFRLIAVKFDVRTPSSLLESGTLASVALGLGFALALFLAMKRWKSGLLLPGAFIGASAAVQIGMMAAGVSAEEARSAGILFSGSSGGGIWPPYGAGDLAYVDWGAFAAQIPNLLTLVVVTLVCVIMNLGGLEVAAKQDLDWNREFRAAGVANLVSGAGGAPPGCLAALPSIRSVLFGATTRLTGLFTAVGLGSMLLLGDRLVQFFPVPLIGGVILLVGVRMLEDWIVAARKRLPATDYGMVLLMFATIVFFGFLEGVAIGMLVTIVFFTIRLSRVDVVEAQFTLRERQSKKFRSVPDRAIVLAAGSRVQGHRLRGYLFFGTAYRLAERLKRSVGAEPAPIAILLDFSNVSGVDFSAVNTLSRFVEAAHDGGATVVLTGAPARLAQEMMLNLPAKAQSSLITTAVEDEALERCEDILLARWRARMDQDRWSRDILLESVVDDVERQLDRQVVFEELVENVGARLERREYGPGDALFVRGEPRQGLQLLIEGHASRFDATGARLVQYSPGEAIEPIGAFESTVAADTTIADESCRTLVLTPETRLELEERDTRQLLRLYEYLFTAGAPGPVLLADKVAGDLDSTDEAEDG